MKKILIILTIIFTIISCDRNNVIKDYGIVTDVLIEQKYDPVIHQYKDIYKIKIVVNDTVISMLTDYKPEIGDTLVIYKYVSIPHKK